MGLRFLRKQTLALPFLCLALAILPSTSLAHGGDDDDDGSSSSSSASSFSNSSGSNSSASSSQGSSAHSHSSGSSSSAGSSTSGTTVHAQLSPAVGIETQATGRAQFRRRSATQPARFHVKVRIPLGASVPNVLDVTQADTLPVTARVIRQGIVVSSCSLDFIGTASSQAQGSVAKYSAAVRSKSRRRVRTLSGECVSALHLNAVIPNLKKNDTVQVETVENGVFLERTIQ